MTFTREELQAIAMALYFCHANSKGVGEVYQEIEQRINEYLGEHP